MIERQRILLAFIDRAGRVPPKTHLMKWLFLMREEQPRALGRSAFYEFVPYKFGPFSFQAYRDIAALEDAGLLENDELVVPKDARAHVRDELQKLPRRAMQGVEEIIRVYGQVSAKVRGDSLHGGRP